MELVVAVIGKIGDREQRQIKRKFLRTAVKAFIIERFSNTQFDDVVFAVKDDRLWDFVYSSGFPVINDNNLFKGADVIIDLSKLEIKTV